MVSLAVVSANPPRVQPRHRCAVFGLVLLRELGADAKRRILEIICLNCSLNGITLVPEIRKPFDALAEELA
jgi:hypothetical protein